METRPNLVGASLPNRIEWTQLQWAKLYRNIRRLQARIVQAQKEGKKRKVRALQFILTRSLAGKALAVRRVTENRGKRTAGVDGQVWKSTADKTRAMRNLSSKGYRAKPLKRGYRPKPNGQQRPLGIPTMTDRAQQALHKLALEPLAETAADPNSYGFRTNRSAHDAIEQCFGVLSRQTYAQWILEGDIKGCFDHINHAWLLQHIPINKKILAQWLKAGVIEQGQLQPTLAGTPQGGIISPLLANMALDGLEPLLRQTFPKAAKVHLVRYADDFIITGASRELLHHQVKPLVEKFLAERGLSLSPDKSTISHINDGFDFLGFNLRKYNGKLIIKPSKSAVKACLLKARTIIKAHNGKAPAELLRQLNPCLRGWANYYRHVCSKQTFHYIDYHIYIALYKWAKRRHPRKGGKWLRQKYLATINGRQGYFFGSFTNKQGQSVKVHRFLLAKVPIIRHIKIRATANPFDPAWEGYFEQRIDRIMAQSLAGRARLTTLWRRQRGLCPLCRQKITTETGWHVHHRLWRSLGGSDRLDNLLLLHPTCHAQLHSQHFSVSGPRPSPGVSVA